MACSFMKEYNDTQGGFKYQQCLIDEMICWEFYVHSRSRSRVPHPYSHESPCAIAGGRRYIEFEHA